MIEVEKDPTEKENLVLTEAPVFDEMEASLRLWYEDVSESGHAFEMPRFLIGSDPLERYPVLAYAPEVCSPGVKSASSYITNFSLPGDYASYAILVEASGSYDMNIHYSLNGKTKAKFEIAYLDEKYSFELLPGLKSVHISDFRLMAGNASFELKNQSTLLGENLKLTEIWFSPKPQD
jgi:hypothetical protein